MYTERNEDLADCPGVLIGPKHVLTTADCLQNDTSSYP